MISSKTKRACRLLQLLGERPRGLIRHEIADQMRIPLSSACSLVNSLIASGEVVATGETRRSPFDHPAGVIALPASKNQGAGDA